MATNEGVTQADLQILIAENPLAAEQLKTIAATRERDELMMQLASVKVCQCDDVQLPLIVDIAS